MPPLFSIVIPVYNVEPYLRACLDSIIGQDPASIEIILVDDNSTDGGGAVCDAYQARHPFVTVLRDPGLRGVSRARNRGLDRATGDHVLFVDGDDVLEPGSLARLERVIRARPGVDLVIGRFVSEHGELSNEALFTPEVLRASTPDALLRHMSRTNYHPEQCWHYAMRRAFLNGVGLRFTDIPIAEDQHFVARMLCLASSAAFLDGPYYWYRERDGSLKKSYGPAPTAGLLRVASSLCRFADESGFDDTRRGFLALRARHAVSLFAARLCLHDDAQIAQIAQAASPGELARIGAFFADADMGALLAEHASVEAALLAYRDIARQKTVALAEGSAKARIHLYCTGPTAMAVLETLLAEGFAVAGILDDNEGLSGRELHGVPIATSAILSDMTEAERAGLAVIVCHPRETVFEKLAAKLAAKGVRRVAHRKF